MMNARQRWIYGSAGVLLILNSILVGPDGWLGYWAAFVGVLCLRSTVESRRDSRKRKEPDA
jgi:hypothetical protein